MSRRDLSELLGPDEHIVLETRQHWWVFIVSAWALLLGAVALVIVAVYAQRNDWLSDHRVGGWVQKVLWIGLAVLLLVVLWKLVNWLVERFYVTTTKVVYARGVLRRDVVSVPLVKLDEVALVRPLLGRALGFGRLDVENASGGRAPLAGLEYLPRPKEIYRTITERARNQRLLEGGGHRDDDGDGLVDRPTAVAPATPVTSAAAPLAPHEITRRGGDTSSAGVDAASSSPDPNHHDHHDTGSGHGAHDSTSDASSGDSSGGDAGGGDGGGGDAGGGE
jgi:membrane protein YdbS with pleckstrin-like domain